MARTLKFYVLRTSRRARQRIMVSPRVLGQRFRDLREARASDINAAPQHRNYEQQMTQCTDWGEGVCALVI